MGFSSEFDQINTGQYGRSLILENKLLMSAWCYPPADSYDVTGLSKIVVHVNVFNGIKQNCFYFDSIGTFIHAFDEAIKYIDKFKMS